MKTKHTPGPWLLADDFPKDKARVYSAEEEVCWTNTKNARLIAAAAELLTAAKGALAALSQNATFQADIDAAKIWLQAAIAKAEGTDE